MTTDEAFQCLKRGDDSAVDGLMERYGARVMSVALRITRNRAEAEEVAQDVFLSVTRKHGTFKGRSSFTTWLHRITVNAALNKRRGLRHAVEIPMAALARTSDHDSGADYVLRTAVDPGASPDDEALSRQRIRALIETIGELPAPYRGVLLLHIEGLSAERMAGTLKLSLAAVKSRLHRAREALRSRIAGDVRLAGLAGALA